MRHGRLWIAIGLTLGVITGSGSAGAQTIWDDPAFQLLRQAMDAMSAKDFPRATELTSQAIARLPNHPLAYYVRGQ